MSGENNKPEEEQPSAQADQTAEKVDETVAEPTPTEAAGQPEAEAAGQNAGDAPKPGEAPAAEGAAGEALADADPEREAKRKAAAEARAARAAAKGDEAGGEPAAAAAPGAAADPEREAKVKAAAEARAARAAAKTAGDGGGEEAPAAPKEPSPNQPRLDRAAALLKELVGDDAVEEAYVNERDGHMPYLIIRSSHWTACAEQLKRHPEFGLNYLRNVSGTDQETHLEVAYHLISLSTKHEYCVKVKTDREQPSVPSVAPIWRTADWNEREIYDLLGIDFPGHPDLRRIMMPDDWVGHPLRKDYEPIDPEV